MATQCMGTHPVEAMRHPEMGTCHQRLMLDVGRTCRQIGALRDMNAVATGTSNGLGLGHRQVGKCQRDDATQCIVATNCEAPWQVAHRTALRGGNLSRNSLPESCVAAQPVGTAPTGGHMIARDDAWTRGIRNLFCVHAFSSDQPPLPTKVRAQCEPPRAGQNKHDGSQGCGLADG